MDNNTTEIDTAKALIRKEQQKRADRVMRRIQEILIEERCVLTIKPMVLIDGREPDIVTFAR